MQLERGRGEREVRGVRGGEKVDMWIQATRTRRRKREGECEGQEKGQERRSAQMGKGHAKGQGKGKKPILWPFLIRLWQIRDLEGLDRHAAQGQGKRAPRNSSFGNGMVWHGLVFSVRSRPGKPNQRKGQHEKFMNFSPISV